MRTVLIISSILCSISFLQGHNQNEINYKIFRDQDQWQLTVHLTPQTVMKTIEHLHPELQNQAVIHIPDYEPDLLKYLQSTISIQFDEQSVTMDFLQSDLMAHDGFIHFRLSGAPASFDHHIIGIESFQGLFRRTINSVFLETEEQTYTCVLTGKNNTCNSHTPSVNNAGWTGSYRTSGTFLLIVVILGSGLIVWRKKPDLIEWQF